MDAIELANRVVEQWDKHDKYRATEADKALWNGTEPDEVAIARALIQHSTKSVKCDCGRSMPEAEAEFWGECTACRLNLPIQSANHGDSRGPATDRRYEGDTGNKGEW